VVQKETSVWKKTQAQKELEESKEEEKEIWKKYLEESLQGKGPYQLQNHDEG
jgi:hypothetical protein